jgi:hypothetical protein
VLCRHPFPEPHCRYRIARCRPFQDSGPAPGSEQAGALPGLIQEVTTQLEGMLGRLRAWGTATGGLRGGRVLQVRCWSGVMEV